ncbi:hypothetical protein BKP35_18570 [Anaerobacillus arseniciselenatis]|uniref:DUF3918 domain-containing protein n=1 Tax=Anaerobacillus arseniciselenatis TaxID=85682 RepID=A0A1S2L5U7_9BACI|nr:hypothetical protein [Anaerobacillus arseniciselenatis]OIJ07684.1 hypothetical protein BKP35_18570 [Anaerobacillus arseniciselenatis]
MRRATLLALGLGAAAFSLTDRKRRKKVARFIEPMANVEMAEMMPTKRTMKKLSKRVRRTLS